MQLAEHVNAPYYTIFVPSDWRAEGGGGTVIFEGTDGSVSLRIAVLETQEPVKASDSVLQGAVERLVDKTVATSSEYVAGAPWFSNLGNARVGCVTYKTNGPFNDCRTYAVAQRGRVILLFTHQSSRIGEQSDDEPFPALLSALEIHEPQDPSMIRKTVKMNLPSGWMDVTADNPDGGPTYIREASETSGALQVSISAFEGGAVPNPKDETLVEMAKELGAKREAGKLVETA